MKKIIYLNDSIHGLISLSEYEKRIISSIGFNRLHDVYQNSTVYLTFPTNRTKRFEHSIGTMKLCSNMFYSSVLNATPENLDTFYKTFHEEYKKIIRRIANDHESITDTKLGGISPKEMPNIELDKFRHSLIPHNVKPEYEIIHLILIQSIRVAALLHDIGHPPFSHIVENALKAVYAENTSEKHNTDRWEEFSNIISTYFKDDTKLHEQMGKEISNNILKEITPNINDEADTYDENLYEILVYESVEKIFDEVTPFKSLHRIIDSSLDGDRLDYVTRDLLNSGIDSGKIDYNRIINDMQLIVDKGEIYFCIPLKALNSVEDFIKRRYTIYKNIIYHHRVIKTDYLLEYSVKNLIKKFLNTPSNNTNAITDNMLIPFDISGLWFPLGSLSTTEKVNALSQWNDSWLMTVLKQIYYTEYYRNRDLKPNSDEYILKQSLSELLRNKKCYYSLIKRSENFKIIDDEVRNILLKNKEEICNLETKINDLSKKFEDCESTNTITVDMKGSLDFIDQILKDISKTSKRFILSIIKKNCSAIKIKSFEDFVKEIVTAEINDYFYNDEKYNSITVFKNISIGLDQPIYFYNYDGHICTLDEISGISDILQLDLDYFPVFYIYLVVEDGEDIIKQKRVNILQRIGEKLGEKIKTQIISELKKSIEQMEE